MARGPQRASTLLLAVGFYNVLSGMQMLVAPHRFTGPSHIALRPSLFWWGVLVALGGAVLLGVALLAPRRRVAIGLHLLGGVGLLLVAGALVVGEGWLLAYFHAALGLAVLGAPFLARSPPPSAEAGTGDLFGLASGLALVAGGATVLVAPGLFGAPQFSVIREVLPACGATFLIAGAGLLCRFRARALVLSSHLIAGAAICGWLIPVHVSIGNISGIAFAAWMGLVLAALPRLGPRLDRIDRESLVTRLTFTIAALASAPMVLAVALLTGQQPLDWAHLDATPATAHRLRDIASVTVLLGMMCAIALGAGIARWIAEPVRRLILATRAVAAGDERVVLPRSAVTELKTLTCDFARMRTQLSAREAELRKTITERAWIERLLQAERDVLELTARGKPFSTALESLCLTLEQLCGEGILASILLVDGDRLRPGAAPTLPAAYSASLDGAPVGENRGSCGTAAHRRQPVLVSDIASDPLWTACPDHRALALEHGLRACWSTPVMGADCAVLGTFALYYRSSRAPSEEHLRLIDFVSRTAATIIERKRAEDERARLLRELEESDARHRSLFTGTAEAILVISADGRYVDVNQAACALTGYDADELKSMRVGDLSPTPERVRANWSAMQRQHIWQGDSELRRRDGNTIPVAALLTSIDLPTGPVFVSALRDISERRAVEQMQREFIALVGHELRNPLSAIQGYATLMNRRRAHDPAVVERIVAQTWQLNRLIGDLLDTYQVETGRLRLQRERTDLGEIVRVCAEEARGLGDDHRIRLTLPEHPVEGYLDPDRINQVLRNLLSNATKYAPAGTEIEIRVDRHDGMNRVAIEDHGPGIAAEALPRLFERFYRTPQAESDGVRGMGIGLYVCRELIQAHGGRIDVYSELGRGSTFVFTLPATDDAHVPAGASERVAAEA